MLRLGHIDYSNCIPIHASLLELGAPGVTIRTGTPTELNRLLAAGEIDVAPCSSIEYARNADRYRILPGLSIAARGPVTSILLETRREPARLDGVRVRLPTASATSVVLLRILLEQRFGVRPEYEWFDQNAPADPLDGAEAALWIGDRALARRGRSRRLIDLGAAWMEWTGLPFVFALWQTWLGPERDAELAALGRSLLASRSWFGEHRERLAQKHAARFGLDPASLLGYWSTLEFGLDETLERGLAEFYRRAAELEEAPGAVRLRYVPVAGPPGRQPGQAASC